MFADAPFPVILYNDSLAAAVGSNRSMVEDGEMPNVASWYVNGAFLSAWYSAGRRGAACVRGRLCGDEPERRVPVWDGGRGRRRYGGYGLI